ncbi:hypothetical protein [uncultured Sphingomonas sp.]|uniref:hypothetical protein n=1 Tax=uncultured Sphingomonas sp. TaxID=158754 RepID=UPI0035CC984C
MTRLLALVLIVLPVPALAQETQATAAARFSREFAATDLNKDGAWTKPEIAARLGRMRAGTKKPDPVNVQRLTDLWFGRADLDKNGRVTEAEAQGLLAAVFQRYDANRDGRIGGGERAAAKAGVQGR